MQLKSSAKKRGKWRLFSVGNWSRDGGCVHFIKLLVKVHCRPRQTNSFIKCKIFKYSTFAVAVIWKCPVLLNFSWYAFRKKIITTIRIKLEKLILIWAGYRTVICATYRFFSKFKLSKSFVKILTFKYSETLYKFLKTSKKCSLNWHHLGESLIIGPQGYHTLFKCFHSIISKLKTNYDFRSYFGTKYKVTINVIIAE